MTDEKVILWAGCYEVVCPACQRRQLLTNAAAHVECEGCHRMIVTAGPQHTFAGNDNGDAHPAGTLTIVTYRWTCPDCGTTNDVRGAAQRVLCGACAAQFPVAEVKAMPANGQMRLM